MIYTLYASDQRFKKITFQKGLNIILADRTPESGDKESRNGLGKSLMINIIHFCLGSNLDKKSLPIEDINDWTFFIEFDLCDNRVTASRSVDNARIIRVDGYSPDTSFPIPPEFDVKNNYYFYTLENWKKLLGICLFGLPNNSNGNRHKYTPNFRDLISYLIRRGLDAYSNTPFVFFRNQKSWQTQVSNSFFLGMNWEHPADVQELKDKDNAVKSLSNAIKTGVTHSKGELEAERVRLEGTIEKEKKALSSFKVHPQYKEFQERANHLTSQMHDLSNKNFVLTRKLERYEESVRSEKAPDISIVSRIYEEAGIHFGDSVQKTLNEAREFHKSIVQNRKHFLHAEIEEIKNEIEENNIRIETFSNERADLLNILHTHGALEEFTLMQERMIEKKKQLEVVKHKIHSIQEMSQKTKEIKSERITVDAKIQRDFEQARPAWEKAVSIFNENSLALYDEPGNLIINTSDSGKIQSNAYSFDVDIPRSNSEGVGKMKIFCYDLMLVELFSQRNEIDFLIHDSTMFDGVDSRQTAHALRLAHRKGIESGFQYICAFNSDMLPTDDFSDDFSVNDYIRLRLHDRDHSGSLLGFRFNE